MKKVKWIAGLTLAVLVLVIVLQNFETVRVGFLFWGISMPLALLVLVTTLIGMALGVLAALALESRGSGDSQRA